MANLADKLARHRATHIRSQSSSPRPRPPSTLCADHIQRPLAENFRRARARYTCPKALAEYAALGLGPNTLRLENDGGGGTKCKHWDEDSFAVAGSSELMTGGFEAGLYQPISRMTVAALDDLGVYGPLNYDAADPYPATRRKLEEGPGFEVLTPTESFTLDGDDEYVVEVEPVPLDA